MKKIIVTLLLATLLVVMSVPAFATSYWNDGMKFSASYGTVNIDGTVSAGEWDDAAAIEMRLNNDPLAASGNINYQGSWEGDGRKDSDYQGTYKIQYDDKYIYFLEIRKDDKVNLGADANEPWTTDGILIFTQIPDADPSVNPDGYSQHIFFTANGSLKVRVCNMADGSRETVDIDGGLISAKTTSDGYIVEVAVPWAMYTKYTPNFKGVKAGDIMGISFVVHDNDQDATGYEKQFCYAIDNDMLGDVPGGYDFGGWATFELLEQVIAIEEVAAVPADAVAAPAATAPAATAPVVAAQTSDASVAFVAIMVLAAAAFVVAKKIKA